MPTLARFRLLSFTAALFVVLPVVPAGHALAADVAGDTIQEARRLNQGGEQEAAARLLRDAIAAWQTKTLNEPMDADAFYQLARLLMEFSSDKEAMAAINQALRLDPKKAEYHHLRSQLARYGNRSQEALTSLRQAVELAPQNADYVDELGNLLLDAGKDEEGAAIFRQALQREPQNSKTAILLAIALRRLKKYDEATAVLKSVLAREPQNGNAHSMLAIVTEAKGDLAGAFDEFATALKLRPEDESVLAKLLMLSEKLRRPADRDKFHATLVELHRQGKTTAPTFVRDEFEVADRYDVVGCENYELTAPNAVRYYFNVTDRNTKSSFRISLGSYDFTTNIARELGEIGPNERLFHLDLYRGPEHETYGMFRKEPTYEQTREMVLEVLTGKRKPQSSSVRADKPSGPIQLQLPLSAEPKGTE
jgi:cytochrome c-type biogenesis protein CcmH/NrfG